MWRTTALAVAGLSIALAAHAEQITGRACYRYSDNESINAARDIALSLAKRDALEGYVVFVQSSSTVENFALKNDLISSITGAFLHNLQVLDQSEDTAKREVCRKISASVEPVEIKNQVTAQINAFKRQNENSTTGLPESGSLKVLKTEKGQCQHTRWDKYANCLEVTALCKQIKFELNGPRITWIDKDGIPDRTIEDPQHGTCLKAGEIFKYHLPLPPPTYTYRIDVPE